MVGKSRKVDFKKVRWGTLTRWLKRHRRAIERRYGDPFTARGEINDNVLRSLAKDEALLKKLSGKKWRSIRRKILFKLKVLKG